jgi:hypothetical protein
MSYVNVVGRGHSALSAKVEIVGKVRFSAVPIIATDKGYTVMTSFELPDEIIVGTVGFASEQAQIKAGIPAKDILPMVHKNDKVRNVLSLSSSNTVNKLFYRTMEGVLGAANASTSSLSHQGNANLSVRASQVDMSLSTEGELLQPRSANGRATAYCSPDWAAGTFLVASYTAQIGGVLLPITQILYCTSIHLRGSLKWAQQRGAHDVKLVDYNEGSYGFTIRAGEAHTIYGQSAVGKTTFIRKITQNIEKPGNIRLVRVVAGEPAEGPDFYRLWSRVEIEHQLPALTLEALEAIVDQERMRSSVMDDHRHILLILDGASGLMEHSGSASSGGVVHAARPQFIALEKIAGTDVTIVGLVNIPINQDGHASKQHEAFLSGAAAISAPVRAGGTVTRKDVRDRYDIRTFSQPSSGIEDAASVLAETGLDLDIDENEDFDLLDSEQEQR